MYLQAKMPFVAGCEATRSKQLEEGYQRKMMGWLCTSFGDRRKYFSAPLEGIYPIIARLV